MIKGEFVGTIDAHIDGNMFGEFDGKGKGVIGTRELRGRYKGDIRGRTKGELKGHFRGKIEGKVKAHFKGHMKARINE